MGQGRLQWLLIPWSDPGLLAVILLAAAAPAFLVSAADEWQRAAADELAAQVVGQVDPGRLGPTVQSEVGFDTGTLTDADAAVVRRVGEIGAVASTTRTSYTLPLLASVDTEPVGVPLRLVGRRGVFDDIEVVSGAPTGNGAIVSTWIAEEFDLAIGDVVSFEAVETGDLATNDVVPGQGAMWNVRIDGLYEPLWTESSDPLPAEWADVPALVPRYLQPFGRPGFALLILDEELLWSSGLSGVVSWHSSIEPPGTRDGVDELRSSYQMLETDLVHDEDLSRTLGAAATPVAGAPELITDLYETAAQMDTAVLRLDHPLNAARRAGLVLGLSTAIGVGLAFVDRRRRDHRLLAGQGHRWFALASRASLQLAPPVVVGTCLGSAVGLLAAANVGPSANIAWNGMDPGGNALLAAATTAIAATVAGVVGQGTLERSQWGTRRRRLAEPIVLLALLVTAIVLMSTAVEGSGPGSELVAVLAPITGSAAALGWSLFGLDRFLKRFGHRGDRLGFVGLLVWRRLVTATAVSRLAAGVFGLGVGILVYSTTMAGTLERSVEVRAATEVGAEVRLDLFGDIPAADDMPERTTLLRVQDTRLTPGGGRLRVLAIDPDTFARGVRWPDEFGSSPNRVVAELAAATDTEVIPAIAIVTEDVPITGGFGSRTVQPFEIVGHVSSLPLAGEFGDTILVAADDLDRVAMQRFLAADTGLDPPPPPSTRFRAHLLGAIEPAEAGRLGDSLGPSIRETHTIEGRISDPDIVATRTSLDYQRLLGAVAAATAVVGLVMLVGARRQKRRAAHVMTAAMGVPSARLSLATAGEVGVLVGVASAVATLTAALSARRLFGRVDPSPAVPPVLDLLLPVPTLALVAVATVVAGAGVAWAADRTLARRASTLDSHD